MLDDGILHKDCTVTSADITAVVICDRKFYNGFVNKSSKQAKFLIWTFALYLVQSYSVYDNVVNNKHADLWGSNNLQLQEISQKINAYVLTS